VCCPGNLICTSVELQKISIGGLDVYLVSLMFLGNERKGRRSILLSVSRHLIVAISIYDEITAWEVPQPWLGVSYPSLNAGSGHTFSKLDLGFP
jgi:hypothetical protein